MAGIDLKEARKQAEMEMGRPVDPYGFEEREIAEHTVNIFFYSVDGAQDELSGTTYRMKVWVDGKRSVGLIL